MMRLLLLLLSCATLLAQRTPLRVNGAVVNNPNVTNSATVTWSVSGTNISAAASGSGGTAGGIVNPESSPSAINGEVFVAAGTSGTNALPSSRTTNVTISAVSKVTGSDNPAFRLYVTNVITDTNLLELAVTTNNVLMVDVNGTIIPGHSSIANWGSLPGAGYLLFSFQDDVTSFGGQEIYLSQYDGAGDNSTEFDVNISSGSASSYIASGTSPTNRHRLTMSVTPNAGPVLTGIEGLNGAPFTRTMFLLNPFIADGSTPYMLGSQRTHTSGNLVEVANNGTNKFTIDYLGNVSTPGIVSADGGAFTNTLTLNGVTVSTAAAANPTGTIGLTAVNGSATTFLRSDGAPALPATGGAYSGSILVPWVGTNNAVTLRWRKAPQVWEFANAFAEWTALTSNSGSATAGATTDGSDVGVFSISTGILTNGVAGCRLWTSSLLFGADSVAMHWRIKTPAALSSDADGYELYSGCGDGASGIDGPPTDGAFFYYLHSVSNGVWCAKTINNTAASFATGAASTVTVTADAWWDLLLEGTSTTVNFWVSSNNSQTWTFIGASSSNIPSTAGRETGIETYIRKVGGSTGTTARIALLGRCVLWPF